ncbi:hypothetical protein Dsin_014842 [Dipteronia sinensis]|uniref:Uncharacterized protein n=1 Tax=Dipteronia sinensis TaxID=43782 RepID=A0AAE0ANW7_9ROSI|nr:hypothetical protein Dsin_014842 [Dipteronia sinensis]
MPVCVANKIERLQREFFLGDRGIKKKIHSIKWAQLCKSKNECGLGIGSVLLKNQGLLAKWVWRFGLEDISLWRRVICAKYGVPLDVLRWDWNCGACSSWFIKTVGTLFLDGSNSAQVLKEGLRVIVGRGDRARFWSDVMVGGSPLKYAFPRIYTLAVDKLGSIRNFGKRIGLEWKWEIILRRLLFNCEKE